MSDEEFGGKVYALRFTELARDESEAAHARVAAFAGDNAADDWEDGFSETLSHLATSPYRPVAVESALFTEEVRAVTYRRGSTAYRILYIIVEESPDGPHILVIHVRHGAAGPMKAYEARNIEANAEETGGL